jgi:hypothetical protein
VAGLVAADYSMMKDAAANISSSSAQFILAAELREVVDANMDSEKAKGCNAPEPIAIIAQYLLESFHHRRPKSVDDSATYTLARQ